MSDILRKNACPECGGDVLLTQDIEAVEIDEPRFADCQNPECGWTDTIW